MLYCQGYTISFQEVPDEVSLVILVGDCPYHCPGCHSPEMQEDIGLDLEQCLNNIIDGYKDVVSCVCFMGDGQDDDALFRCASTIHNRGFRSAVYTGGDEKRGLFLATAFDYVKYGPYIEALGGLDKPSTNQHMIHVTKRFPNDGIDFEDVTSLFQRPKI